jgi:hypothetical protein
VTYLDFLEHERYKASKVAVDFPLDYEDIWEDWTRCE